MAGEIYQAYDSTENLYAFVYRPSDSYIYDVGDTAFEAIGTWNDARADECDIALTAAGDMHFANFPVVAAGTYTIQIRVKAGANPDTDDFILSHGQIVWDGTAEVLASDITADIAGVEGKVDTIDSNVDLMLVELQRVNNVFVTEAVSKKPRIINL